MNYFWPSGDHGPAGPPGLRGPAGPPGDAGLPGKLSLMSPLMKASFISTLLSVHNMMQRYAHNVFPSVGTPGLQGPPGTTLLMQHTL